MMNAGHDIHGNQTMNDNAGLDFDNDFQKHFSEIITSYMPLKDALVASDSEKSIESASHLHKQLNDMEIGMLNDMARAHLQSIKRDAEAISKTDAIDQQREHFKSLSDNIVAIATDFNDLDQPIYVQFCPMADNNKGANWLSFEEKVLNPYFGDKMLTCGRITRTLQ